MIPSVRHAVLRVLKPDGKTEGTAFLVKPAGFALTCWHVATAAAMERRIHLQWRHPDEPAVKIDFYGEIDESHSSPTDALDIALISLPVSKWHPAMQMLSLADWIPGADSIFESYGFPATHPEFGLPALATFINSTSDSSRPALFILRSEELTGGFSGAPLVQRKTQAVIGMVDATIKPDPRGKFRDHAVALPARLIGQVANVLARETHPLIEALRSSARLSSATLADFAVEGIENLHEGLEPQFEIAQTEPTLTDDVSAAFRVACEGGRPLILLVGPGGSGKTSVLKRLQAEGHLLLAPVFPNSTIVVLRVGGPQLAQVERSGYDGTEEHTLWAALSATNALQLPFPGSGRIVGEILNDKCIVPILLVDALDEVQEERYRLIDRISMLIAKLREHGGIVLVASRAIRELDALRQIKENFVEVALRPVGMYSISRFSQSYLSNQSTQFLAEFSGRGWLGLDPTPLKVAMAASSFYHSGRIAESESWLLGDYCDAVLRRTLIGKLGWNQDSSYEARRLLAGVAFQHVNLGDRPVRQFVSLLAKERAEKDGINVRRLEKEITEEVVELQNYGVLVIGTAANLSFSHISIRDWLASLHVASLLPEDRMAVLTRFQDQRWRTVVIYALANSELANNAETMLRETLQAADCIEEGEAIDFIVDCMASGVPLSIAWRTNIVHECLQLAAKHEEGERSFFRLRQNKCVAFYLEVPREIVRLKKLSFDVAFQDAVSRMESNAPFLFEYASNLSNRDQYVY